MYAYVEYEDGVPAIVSTALIKNFKPKSLSDIDCTLRKTYWKSGSGKNAIGNYYNARVKMLGETKSQLITTMAAARISIPEIIDFSNEDNEKTEVGVQEQDPYKEVGWRNPKKRKMTEKESSVQKDSNRQTKGKKPKRRRQEVEETDETDCDVDDDVVPRQSLVEEQKKVRDLKSKISKLRNELDEERKLVRRLQLTLLTKIDLVLPGALKKEEADQSQIDSSQAKESNVPEIQSRPFRRRTCSGIVCSPSLKECAHLNTDVRKSAVDKTRKRSRRTSLSMSEELQGSQECTNTGGKRHVCNVCEKSFERKSQLGTHIRIHTGERPFTCRVCEMSFSQKGNLSTHFRIHTGARPFSCNVCGKSFTHKGALNRHNRTHTGERPFRCRVCEKSFSQKYNLDAHIRIHSGVRRFPCSVSEKSFPQKNHPDAHTRTHTGESPST